MSFDKNGYLDAFAQSVNCPCTGCQWARRGVQGKAGDVMELLTMAAEGKSKESIAAAGRATFPDADLAAIEAEIATCPCPSCAFYREREAAGEICSDLGAMAADLGEVSPETINARTRALLAPSD